VKVPVYIGFRDITARMDTLSHGTGGTPEYAKLCSFPGCPGTMVYSLRAVITGGTKRRPGWVCGKNPDHIEWVFGLDVK